MAGRSRNPPLVPSLFWLDALEEPFSFPVGILLTKLLAAFSKLVVGFRARLFEKRMNWNTLRSSVHCRAFCFTACALKSRIVTPR